MNEPLPLERVQHAAETLSALEREIGKVVVGQREVIAGVITCLLTGGHALLEGVPGLGKTVLVRAIARAVDLRFSRVQFTPDLVPSDVLGTTVITEDERGRKAFTFQQGPIFSHIVLADEVNRTTPKTQSALLEAMQERSVTIAGTTHALPEPFCVLATQNPLEMEGTYPLPEAQLDRFLLKLHVGFPSRDELHDILDRTTGQSAPEPSPSLSRDALLALRATVRDIAVARPVQDYVVRLLEATHKERPGAPELVQRYVRYGASPRGAQACLLAGKARALLAGRVHVAVADVRAVATAALRHRIILSFEGEAEGVTTDRVIAEVLSAVPETV